MKPPNCRCPVTSFTHFSSKKRGQVLNIRFGSQEAMRLVGVEAERLIFRATGGGMYYVLFKDKGNK